MPDEFMTRKKHCACKMLISGHNPANGSKEKPRLDAPNSASAEHEDP